MMSQALHKLAEALAHLQDMNDALWKSALLAMLQEDSHKHLDDVQKVNNDAGMRLDFHRRT